MILTDSEKRIYWREGQAAVELFTSNDGGTQEFWFAAMTETFLFVGVAAGGGWLAQVFMM